MDEHPRTLLSEGLVALLINANTAAGMRVDDTRVEPHRKSQLPAAAVYILSEEVDKDASTPLELTIKAKVEVALWASHSEALSCIKAVNRLAKQVQAAVVADPYIGGTASDTEYDGTTIEIVEDDGRSDPLVAVATLAYSATYRMSLAAAEPTDDFERVNATHKLTSGVPTTAPPSDLFTVEETTP